MTNRYGAHVSVAGGSLVLTLSCIAIYLAIGSLVALAFQPLPCRHGAESVILCLGP